MATRAEVQALRTPAIPVGAVLFGVWAVGTALIVIVRPGQLLEFATVGIVGAVAWRAFLRKLGWADLLIAGTCLVVPLLNTWPGRVYQSLPGRAPEPVPALLGALSVAGCLLLALRLPIRWSRFPRILTVAAGAFTCGGAIAALLSGNVGPSVGALWSAVIVPIAIAALVVSSVRKPDDGWRALSLVALGALVPMTIAVAAFVLSFGLPLSGADLLKAKVLLVRPHLLQEATFGNVGHLADFALLVMPVGLIGVARTSSPRLVRIALMLTAIGSVLMLILTVSRSALLIGSFATLAVTVVLVRRRAWRAASVPLIACAVLTAISLSPPIWSSVTELVPRITVAPRPSAVPAASPGATEFPSGGIETSLGSVIESTSEEADRT